MPVGKALALILLLCALLTGCVDPYDPDIEDSQESLVVEALITDQAGWQVIHLSRSSPVNEKENHAETGAYVSLSDDQGFSMEFLEQAPGEYYSLLSEGELGAGKTYRLNIVTSDGEVYESEPETLPSPSPAIDEVYWDYETQGGADRTESVKGIRFFLDVEAEADQGRNFRWELEETWEYYSEHPIDYYYDGLLYEWPDSFIYHTCWSTENIQQIYTATTQNAESNTIKGFPLHFVSEAGTRLQARYSLQVSQYSLNDEAFSYWKQIEEQNQESGGIYERQLDYISGNMYNMNNQEENVLGFFNLCPVSETRIFLDSVPELTYPPIDCTLESIMHPEARPSWLSIPFFLISLNPREFGPPYGVGGNLCFDCRNGGGTIIKPEFWE